MLQSLSQAMFVLCPTSVENKNLAQPVLKLPTEHHCWQAVAFWAMSRCEVICSLVEIKKPEDDK